MIRCTSLLLGAALLGFGWLKARATGLPPIMPPIGSIAIRSRPAGKPKAPNTAFRAAGTSPPCSSRIAVAAACRRSARRG